MPSNFARTGLLLVVLTGIFAVMGALVGGREGLVIAFVVALATNAFAYWNSDTVVLKMFKAREVSRADAPELHQLVAALAARASLPMPKVYVVDSPQPNAFATGRNPANAAVAVSTGLVDQLTWEELAGVVAHELAHVRNRDTLTMTVAATIAGAISMFANVLQFGVLFGGSRQSGPLGWLRLLGAVLVAPFAAMMVQMAISRSREYEADRIGSQICGEPLWLASALAKIHEAVARTRMGQAETAPAAAHLFIVNPLSGGRRFDNMFTTHPNVENRIAALQDLSQQWRRMADAPRPIEIALAPAPRRNIWDGNQPGPASGGPWS